MNKDEENIYTVYMHTNKVNDKKYIGITKTNPKERWKNGLGYKTQIFYRAIQKYGWDNFKHEILFEKLNKEEAEQKEIELIAFYKSDNKDFGYNVNHGGNCIGTMSEATRRKLSNAFKGRKLTPEWLEHRTKAQTGLKRSKETVDKIRAAASVKVICINDRQIYDSLTIASEVTGVGISHISQCCNKHRKSAGRDINGKPMVWMFYDEYMDINGSEKTYEEIAPIRLRDDKPKPVICLNTGEVYNSIADAAKDKRTYESGISQCCNNKAKTSGTNDNGESLRWMFYNDYLKQGGDICA